MSSPPMRMRPTSGRTKPAIMRSVVVLPQPDGPRREKNSPSSTRSETSSTASVSPKRFVRPVSSTSDTRRPVQPIRKRR